MSDIADITHIFRRIEAELSEADKVCLPTSFKISCSQSFFAFTYTVFEKRKSAISGSYKSTERHYLLLPITAGRVFQ